MMLMLVIPYIHPVKEQYLKKKVKYILDNDFIESSKSNSSSPCILFQKLDGSYITCTNYGKVNNVTKSDIHPIPRIDKVGNPKIVVFDFSLPLSPLRDTSYN